MKRILLICSDPNSVVNFRSELIRYLKSKGNEVFLVLGGHDRDSDISNLGVRTFYLSFNNRSKNPFSAYALRKSFVHIIRQVAPDIVFTFQIKANIFGTLAAKKAGIKRVFCMVEGLGDPFQPKTLRQKILMLIVVALYKCAMKNARLVFFLNQDDRDEFLERRIIKSTQAFVINSIGIDTSKYEPTEVIPSQKKVLYLARLIKNKGIMEFCELARLVRSKRPDIEFELYGKEAEIRSADLAYYIDKGFIFYGGFTTDPISVIKRCRVLCTTSYREGFPRIILEAMALGKPVLASNVIGNKSAVVDGVTGYLFELSQPEKTADLIIRTVDNVKLLREMGQNARKHCVEECDSNIINEKIWKAIDK